MTGRRGPGSPFCSCLIIVSAFIAMGCKPAAGTSSVQSLDNFARDDGAKVESNTCGVQFSEAAFQALAPSEQAKLARIEAPTAALKRAAAGALAAVPLPLQTFFFSSRDNRILIAADSAGLCVAAGLTEEERRFAAEAAAGGMERPVIDSCWRLNGGHLEIVMPADAEKISHSLVRLFGYVYTQLVVERFGTGVTDPEVQAKIRDGKVRYLTQAEAIGQAFLEEPGIAAKAKARLAALATNDPAAFRNFVVSETIDSYYCSARSQGILRDRFKKVWDAFTLGPNAMQKDLGSDLGHR